ncbi:hypothetical protein [Pedobacter gandavensis]|uniref:hypothetical protein n=1 Tax=Pedobacter gandavensis TaxID=2679963 RepID=UPI0029300E2A|nr:hypothetical protein [Pedobacter gandavensis]
MEKHIQIKIDQLIEKAGVVSSPTVFRHNDKFSNDSLLKVIRSKEDADTFMAELYAAAWRCKQQK